MTIDEMIARKNELGYSCERISDLSGVPLGTVQKIFSRITKRPRFATIEALERILKKRTLTYNDLARGDDIAMVAETDVKYGAGNTAVKVRSILQDVEEGVWSRQGTYTVDDYMKLPDEVRVELIDGVIYEMNSPTGVHQVISMELSVEFSLFIRNNKGKCRVLAAPFDVQLDKDDKTMVQPDILVICSSSQVKDGRGYGAPDLVVEILSPSTKNKDMKIKLRKYEAAGVREYWIIDPYARVIIVYNFEKENLTAMYTFKDKVPVGIWDGKCVIDFKAINAEVDGAIEEGYTH